MRAPQRLAAVLVCFLSLSMTAKAGFIFTESWETPDVAPGAGTATLPSPWQNFSGINADIWHLTTTTPSGGFDSAEPLAAPADGDQALRLAGTNTGIYRMGGVTIEPDTIYTLSAAIGDARANLPPDSWSLQLWADTNASGIFEGSGFDTFIGQEFALTPTAVTPASGEWALNQFSFSSNTVQHLFGQEVVVFLNNFGQSESWYDSVSLSETTASAVPEPSSLALLGIGAISMFGAARRRLS